MKLSVSRLLLCCWTVQLLWCGHTSAANDTHNRVAFPLFPTVASGETDQPTAVTVLHVQQQFSPLLPLPFNESLLRLMMNGTHYAWQRNAQKATWRYAAATPNLSIAILGTSITSGVGAAETTSLQVRSSKALIKKGSSPSGSWSRHFVDFLHRHLERQGFQAAVNVSVDFKNAASPVRYSHCTHSFVSRAARIVIIETASHLFEAQSLEHDLAHLIAAVRRVAPKAAILLVEWPNAHAVGSPTTSSSLLAAYSSAAKRLNIDLFRGDIFLQKLSHTCPDGYITAGIADGRPCYWQLFADRAKDHFHPNPWGHQLLGGLVARHVAQSLFLAARKRQTSTQPFTQPTGPAAPGMGSMVKAELCYQLASSLPLATNGTYGEWRLVDEGAAKGVQKLGLLSTKLDDVLSLDVTRDLPSGMRSSCGLLSVSLNYLFSTTIAIQGALMLACRGCACSPYPVSNLMSPFPFVDTNANYASNVQYRGLNVSVSAQTSFIALRHSNMTCYLDIRHVPSASNQTAVWRAGAASAASRVRVDSLFVEPVLHTNSHRHLLDAKPKRPVGAIVSTAKRLNCSM